MHRLQLMTRLRRLSERLRRDVKGSILPLFALSLIPMVLATGMSIDYAKAMRVQNMLSTAADAAAMAAVSKQIMSATQDGDLPSSYSPIIGEQTARRIFSETAQRLIASGAITLDLTDEKQFSIVLEDNDNHTSRTATISFHAQSPNAFAQILRWASLPIKGVSTSTVSAGLYTDMYIVLDTSQSMGLAATDEDAVKLWQATGAYTGHNCTFGCHVPGPGMHYSNEWIANQVGAKMRIDVLKDATDDMIDTAIKEEQGVQKYRFGLYRIGAKTGEVAALTYDLPSIQSAAKALTLGPSDSGGPGDTNLKDVTDTMYDRIINRGNGTTKDNPRSFLFIVTDGLYDVQGPWPGWCRWNHCTGPIDPKDCDRYKDNNVTVAIVYTTYKPVYANPLSSSDKTLRGEYTDLVIMHEKTIEPSLRACASKGWYFEASDGPTIHKAMQKLFAQALQTPILTR